MNSLTSEQLRHLQAQLQQLLSWAQQLDRQRKPGKPVHWFDSALFSCHSPDLADYVQDSVRNLNRLQQQADHLSTIAKQRITERLNEQISALTQAFRLNQVRQQHQHVAASRSKAAVQQLAVTGQQLYQQLSEYQQYESRLLDMVRQAERESDAEATNRTLTLHGRLGRCRKAIYEVELAIQKLESGKNR
ncbi:primosomal replication protein PriC [Alishewanella sp. HL-SH05]|uniref:primosomal replication protein PriC n=1 Tax=Alishewanella sp. HL-SH05 TaxID=3461145 RepID=UPI004040EA47